MNRLVGIFATLTAVSLTSCGGRSGQAALTPHGSECGVAPPGDCQIDASHSDTQRFTGLNALSKELLEDSHPLRNATLVGGQAEHPIGTHVQTVAVLMSTWDSGQTSNEPSAVRRREGGDLYAISQRLRCAADQSIKRGASAKSSELVCWSLELWRVGRAYRQLASK